MGLKYKRNTSGWTPTKEDNLINNDDPWTADFRVRKESKKKKEGQTDGKGKLKTLEIEAYTDKGDFYVKEPGTETSILRYNGRTDEIVINDEEKFEEYFAGSKEKEKRLNKIKKITMKDILAIAESEVNKAETRTRTNEYPRRDAKRLKRVFNYFIFYKIIFITKTFHKHFLGAEFKPSNFRLLSDTCLTNSKILNILF